MRISAKKIISIILTAALLLSFTGLSVFATEEEKTYTWSIDEYGVLTISGTGELSFGSEYSEPWWSDRSKITSVVVEEGITVLGSNSLRALPYLKSVEIPSSVTTIGQSAFEDCTFLQAVVLPEKLEKIGYAAFSGCKSLKEITIPDTVTAIDRVAFENCTALKKAVFNGSLSTLPGNIFSGCTSLETVAFPKGLTALPGGCFSNCSSLKQITLPETVVTLGGYTFSGCTSLSSINTENILEYNSRDFEGCSSLNSITINEAVKIIPAYMLSDSGIISISLPENLNKIEAGAFSGCSRLEAITIPESVTSLGSNAFKACTLLKKIKIPKNITIIENSTFNGCTALGSVDFNDNITSIESEAFEGCTELKSVVLPKSLTKLNGEIFRDSGITEITIPDSLNTVYSNWGTSYSRGAAFSGTSLETVHFGANRTEIPDNMFLGADKLKNVDLSNIKRIGNRAFEGCAAFVPNITSKTTEIGSNAFKNCTSIEDFEIPAWMEKIPDGMLSGTSIGYLAFPKTVKEIGANAYQNCTKLSYIGFSDTITAIGNYAFYGCTALDEVDIPGNVISIGQSAFESCSNLKKLTMHKGTQTLGGYAFANCALTEIRPSQTIRELDDCMFYGNPVSLLVVPRFCKTWTAWGNFYNNFNPAVSYVPANVESFDIYTYDQARIIGVKGTAGEAEADEENESGRSITFIENTAELDTLCFDIHSADISLDETYDAAAVVTAIPGYFAITSNGLIIEEYQRAETDGELISFASDNEEVAVVDGTGYVHGVGYGTAKITISCPSGKSDVLTVNVVRPSIGVAISSGYEELSVGDTVTLTADTIPSGYEETYTWSTSDAEIASVTQEGVVTAIKEGTAVISVSGTYSKKTAKCVVTVAPKETLPDNMGVEAMVIGCEIKLTETENGGDVIAALYNGSGKLLDAAVYSAAERLTVNFAVSPTEDLTDAQLKIFWWNSELMRPISQFKLFEAK